MAQGNLKSKREILRLREVVGLLLENCHGKGGLTEILTVADALDWVLGRDEQSLEGTLGVNLDSVFMEFAA